MIKLIKKSDWSCKEVQFNIGDEVQYFSSWSDGRSSQSCTYTGVVIKVHKVNLDFEDLEGNVYRASKDKVTKK